LKSLFSKVVFTVRENVFPLGKTFQGSENCLVKTFPFSKDGFSSIFGGRQQSKKKPIESFFGAGGDGQKPFFVRPSGWRKLTGVWPKPICL
jgi:hypothetical protein